MHEAIHAYGMGTHDEDPNIVLPDYSVMRQGGRVDTLQAYDRMYRLSWLPDTTTTLNPNLVSDLSGATSAEHKYLLDIGTGSDGLQCYQELFEGNWIQYRVESNAVYYEQTNISGSLDSDRDGVNDIADNDDDNEGIPDGQDSSPLGPDAPQTPQSIFNNLLDTVQKVRRGQGFRGTP